MVFDKKAYMKEWREKNKESIKEYHKSSRRISSSKISVWKQRGIRCDGVWDEVYEWFSNTTNCNICDKLFVVSKDKCLDHDHHLDGYNIRGILCQRCNHRANEL
tara:strand:- start:480 stop:791 length:312 start_codon:yes stop_codon:yes gene_type:complete